MPIFASDASMWIAFAAAYGFVLLTPGPNLVLVLDAACVGSRRVALASALGVACGAAVLALVAFVAGSVFIPSEAMGSASRAAFGAFVVALGLRTMLSAANPPGVGARLPGRPVTHFQIGFATAFANPFTGLFFLAATSGLGSGSGLERAALCGLVFAFATLWFAAVALVGGAAMRSLRRGSPAGARIARGCRVVAGVALVTLGLCRFMAEAAP